jgi:hypothetical protein
VKRVVSKLKGYYTFTEGNKEVSKLMNVLNYITEVFITEISIMPRYQVDCNNIYCIHKGFFLRLNIQFQINSTFAPLIFIFLKY